MGNGDRGLHPATTIDRYEKRGWWTKDVADQVFLDQVEMRGDALAIVDPSNRHALVGSDPRRLSWDELSSEVMFLAARLLERGVGRDDVIAVQMPNSIELVEVYLATWMIGAVVSPLAMQFREHELLAMAKNANFKTLITCRRFGNRDMVAEAKSIGESVPSIESVFTLGPADELEQAPSHETEHIAPTSASPEDVAAVQARRAGDPNDPNDRITICWTSGTESEPKGVQRTHYEWMAASWYTVDAPRMVADDVLLNPFPMINMAGINGMLLPWLRTGAVLVQHHPFDMGVFFEQIARERVTYTLAPPALLWEVLNNDDLLSAVDLSSLTRIGSGSAPLQPAMVRGWQERFGIGILNFFGSNEGVALLSNVEDFPDPDKRARFFPRYGVSGIKWASRIAERITLKLVDTDTQREIVEPGVPGELRFGGPTVFPGYLNGESVPSPFDEEGLLRTGDIFVIAGDQNQYLRYLDRSKDLIIRGGMNIAPVELEGLIAEHPSVAEVAVVGDPEEVLGERVAAVVSLKPGKSLTLKTLVEFLRGRKIASYKLPERLEILEELPRNPVGKVVKRELRKARP